MRVALCGTFLASVALSAPASAEPDCRSLLPGATQAFQRKDLAGAEARLKACLRAEPDNPDAQVDLAEVYLAEGNHPGAVSELDGVLAKVPSLPKALNARAILYLEEGDLDRAVAMFVRSAQADPTSPTPLDNLGDTAVLEGDALDAVRYFDLALKVAPQDSHAAVELSRLESAAGAPFAPSAVRRAQEVLRREPRNYPAMLALGMAWAAEGDWAKAVESLSAAVKGLPGSVEARYALAMAYLNGGQPRHAIQPLLEALDRDDRNPALHLQLGIAYALSREPTLVPYAREEFRHCLDRHPQAKDAAAAWFQTAALEEADGRHDQALEGYRKSIALDPGSAVALDSIGVVLDETGRPEEAASWHRKAIAAEPAFYAARLNLGASLVHSGKRAEGRAELEKLLRLPDRHPVRLRAQELLASL